MDRLAITKTKVQVAYVGIGVFIGCCINLKHDAVTWSKSTG